MPFSIEKLQDCGISCVTVDGEITAELVIDLINAILGDERYQQTQDVVIRTGEELHLNTTMKTLREIEAYSKANDHNFTGSRWAFVAPALLHFGLARMYQTWRDDASYEVATFRNLADAVAYLTNTKPDD